MTKNDFIFGSRENVDGFARAKRWQSNGRASWVTPDGDCVLFLAIEEQLAAVGAGDRIYIVGKLNMKYRRALKKAGAVIVEARM